ncbi:ribose ABC transport system [Klebsiella grimontii]|uniref:Ribose ABC transport system n=1 Tax=Klebsiella grimontii TaxID=2058152 RepID=A0A7H4P8J8_9ENTR|nr:ribose ABC transport system [Klebsiella grimontii]
MMTQAGKNSVLPSSLIKFNVRDAGTLIGLLIIIVTFSFLSPVFLTLPNLLNVLQQSSINALIALGMTLVIISGGIDLSVGPTAAMSAVFGAALMVAGIPVPLAVVLTLCVGAACGLFSGTLIAWAGLQPFIVTLGGLSLFRAIALIFTGGNPVFGIPATFRDIINSFMVWRAHADCYCGDRGADIMDGDEQNPARGIYSGDWRQ